MKKQRGLKRYYNNLQTKNDDWSGLNFIDPENLGLTYGIHILTGTDMEITVSKSANLTLTSYSDFDLLIEKAKTLKQIIKFGLHCSTKTVQVMHYFCTPQIQIITTSPGK